MDETEQVITYMKDSVRSGYFNCTLQLEEVKLILAKLEKLEETLTTISDKYWEINEIMNENHWEI